MKNSVEKIPLCLQGVLEAVRMLAFPLLNHLMTAKNKNKP